MLLVAAGGCDITYIVRRADLDEVAALAPKDRPAVISARREGGPRVLLRTRTVDLDDQAGLDYLRRGFARADRLQRSGQPSEAARELRDCRQRLTPDDRRVGLQRDVGFAVSIEQRTALERAIGEFDEQRAELTTAIDALEKRGGAGVSISALHAAAPYLADRSSEVTVRPRNRVLTTGKALAIVGAGLAVVGAIAGGAMIGTPGNSCQDCAGGIIGIGLIGGFVGMGANLMLTGVILAGTSGHAAEGRRSLQLLDAGELEQRVRRARRMVLGGGVSAALSVVAAAAGTILLVKTPYPYSFNGYTPPGWAPDTFAAGEALTVIGGAALVPSVGVFAAGLSDLRKLRRMERGPATAQRRSVLLPAPWITRDGGGLGVAGAF